MPSHSACSGFRAQNIPPPRKKCKQMFVFSLDRRTYVRYRDKQEVFSHDGTERSGTRQAIGAQGMDDLPGRGNLGIFIVVGLGEDRRGEDEVHREAHGSRGAKGGPAVDLGEKGVAGRRSEAGSLREGIGQGGSQIRPLYPQIAIHKLCKERVFWLVSGLRRDSLIWG